MRIFALLAILGAASIGPALASPAEAADADVVKEYQVTHKCTGKTTDGWCTPERKFQVKTTKKLVLFYSPSKNHCTPVNVRIGASGATPSFRDFNDIAPGGAAQSYWEVARGAYELVLTVSDAPGGCPGPIQSWAGLVRITTTDDGTLNAPSPAPKTPSAGSNPRSDPSTSGSGSGGGGGNSGSGAASSGGSQSSSGSAGGSGASGAQSSGSPDPRATATPQPSSDDGTLAARVSDKTSFPWWVIIAGLGLVAVLGGGGFAFWRRRSQA